MNMSANVMKIKVQISAISRSYHNETDQIIQRYVYKKEGKKKILPYVITNNMLHGTCKFFT